MTYGWWCGQTIRKYCNTGSGRWFRGADQKAAEPKWSGLLAAIRQVEASAAPNEIPVAVIKKKFANDEDTLCIMRLSSFLEWFGGGRES